MMMKRHLLIAALFCGAAAHADSQQAARSFFAGDASALTRLQQDAANGNAQASLQLATIIYSACLDVPCLKTTREKYLAFATKQGSQVPNAMKLYQAANATDSTAAALAEAVQSLDRLAAASNDPEVWVYDAVININNHGPLAQKLGISYLAKASAAGVARADRFIATMYLQGIGVKRNMQQGLIWLSSAVKKGDPVAANELGTAYQLGRYNLTVNDPAAEATYRTGVNVGCSGCAVKLSEMLRARGGKKDLEEAVRLTERLDSAGSYYKTARTTYDDVIKNKGSASSFAALEKLARENQFGLTFYVIAAGKFPQNADLRLALGFVKSTDTAQMVLPATSVVSVRAALKESGR